ncbi:2-dehydropantoate 2-reductase N-terminal domain-containing protein [Mycobacterium sp. 236(2023)]|uniref:ketopantoate reductase family protein n=1 Tax=Mycobacterium sp. 236(2023) TaxID=3038163 RepID=UPI002414EADF|nr:2-dehydropantoate 2-reductase N-terminal domain-containing protein [Mycobacterium sp. 236(2023)]MDG4663788.1 2-dehydropantoate 2-reductase N-terminal domain-containing protein [Mycobacterium sp. 236(2023)]
MPATRRFIIIGAGSIGGGTGGTLARGGVDVVLVARGAHAEALAEQGLTLRTPDGVFEVPVASAAGPDGVRLTSRDVLVFATKTHQLDAALQEWADRPVFDGDRDGDVVGTAGQVLPALTALNGVSAEDKALRYFARVFGVCVWMPASFPSPGEVIVRSWPVAGQFHIARWPAALTSAEDRVLVDEIAAGWSAAGILVQQPADVAPWKYNKLLSNLSNAIVALTGTDSRDDKVSAAVRREAEEVLTLAGIEWVSFETSKAARAQGPTPRPVAGAEGMISNSTWQSLARKSGSVETDYLNGEIARIAHRHGATAPLNALLARLTREAAASGKGPGVYTVEDLARLAAQ